MSPHRLSGGVVKKLSGRFGWLVNIYNLSSVQPENSSPLSAPSSKTVNRTTSLSCCGNHRIVAILENLLVTSDLGNICKPDHRRFNLLERAMRSFMTDRSFAMAACLNTVGSVRVPDCDG